MNFQNMPLVIGATGGSGTQPVTRICRKAGYYLGARLNVFLDATDFIPFYTKWVDVTLSSSKKGLSEAHNKQMFGDFYGCIQKHRSGMPNPNAPWGWKCVRSIYMVPFFHALFPHGKFIHIIRDGRDIAFLHDPQQLLQHTRALFDKQFDSLLRPYRLMLLWNATNLTIANYAETHMRYNYIRIRLEDLCENPYGMIKRLMRFLGAPNVDVTKYVSDVKRPDSIGRWHAFPVDIIEQMEALGKDGLVKFGYM